MSEFRYFAIIIITCCCSDPAKPGQVGQDNWWDLWGAPYELQHPTGTTRSQRMKTIKNCTTTWLICIQVWVLINVRLFWWLNLPCLHGTRQSEKLNWMTRYSFEIEMKQMKRKMRNSNQLNDRDKIIEFTRWTQLGYTRTSTTTCDA